MASRFLTTLTAADCRYLTAAEQQQLLEYARSLPRRQQAARHVEAGENDIVSAAVSAAEPVMDGGDDSLRGRLPGDARLVLRAVVQGMLMDDPDAARDKAVDWLRTLYVGLDARPDVLRAFYTGLRDGCSARLGADDFKTLEPFLSGAAAALSDLPAPLSAG